MNKRKLLIVLAIVAALVGAGIYIASRPKPESTNTEQSSNVFPAGSKKACELLTLSAAKGFLGEDSVRNASVPNGSQGSTEDVDMSNCTYSASEGSSNSISLTVRGAHNSQASYNTNVYAFEDARLLAPESTDGEQASEDVPSLGDNAYYNPSSKQTNILVKDGQYWLIIQASDKDTQRKVGHKVLQQLGL